jgi:hypothetical protein
MKQVPYAESTDIRHHRTKCSRHGDLAPGVCTPLHKHLQPEVHFRSIKNEVSASQNANKHKALDVVQGGDHYFTGKV